MKRKKIQDGDFNMDKLAAVCASSQRARVDGEEPIASSFEKFLVPGKIKSVMKVTNSKSRDLWQVPPECIRLMDGFNIRIKNSDYHTHIRQLADSIKLDGFFADKPLGAYVANENGEEVIYLHDGHCRLEAVKIAIQEGADIQNVPLVVSPPGTSLEDLTVSLVRSNSGKPLSPYEAAVVCKRLSRYGWSASDIAKRIGFSANYVAKLLALAGAPLHLREMVVDGVVSADVAIQMLSQHGSNAVPLLAEAKNQAEVSGDTKVTKKHIHGENRKAKLKKAAEPMYQAIDAVKRDSGFAALSEDVRQIIEKLLADLHVSALQPADQSA